MKKFLTLLLLVLLVLGLSAQWSIDSSQPNLIAGFTGEQVLPKVAITPNGNTYICRFDNQSGGYAVYLQLFNAAGIPQWTDPLGVLVSSQPQMTWLTDWDMTVDQAGNALIVFQDIRNAGVNNVFVYKVSPQGILLWQPDGIALSYDTNPDFANMSPTVFNSIDNSAYIAWQKMGNTTSIVLHRLSHTGQKLWGEDGITLSSASSSYTWPQIVQSDGDNIILKYYNDSGPFWAPTRHLYMAKINPEGTMLWNTIVSQAGGISAWQQVLAYESDGYGGAVIAWYDDRNSDNINEVYIQRVDIDGNTTMPDNGAMISTDTANQQYYPKIAVDPSGHRVFAFYKTTNSGQTSMGMNRQLLDFQGNRQWGDQGQPMYDLSQYGAYPIAAYLTSYGAVCIFERGTIPNSDMNTNVLASCYRANGQTVWESATVGVATNGTNKLHYDLDKNPDEWIVLVWEEGTSNNDLYGMRLNHNGSLGMLYPAPVNVSATLLDGGGIQLNWQQAYQYLNPICYHIYLNGSFDLVVSGATTEFVYSPLPAGNYSFYLLAIYDGDHYSAPSETAEVTLVSVSDNIAPELVFNATIHPNPVLGSASLSFDYDKPITTASLEIYNLKGQLLHREQVKAIKGTNTIPIEAANLKNCKSGVHLVRLSIDGKSIIKKMIVLK